MNRVYLPISLIIPRNLLACLLSVPRTQLRCKQMSISLFSARTAVGAVRCRRPEQSDAVRRHRPGAGRLAPALTLTVAPADSGQVTRTGLHQHDRCHRHDLHQA
jgi:hypothetical protein